MKKSDPQMNQPGGKEGRRSLSDAISAAGPIPQSLPLKRAQPSEDAAALGALACKAQSSQEHDAVDSGPLQMSDFEVTVDDLEHQNHGSDNVLPLAPGSAEHQTHWQNQETQSSHLQQKKSYSSEELASEFMDQGLPDVLPFASGEGSDNRLVALNKPSSVMSEEYRSIRTSVLARWENKRHLVHTITSATPQEGKTITSLNLGFSLAELHNRKTIVIEADLRLPQFGKLLNLNPGPGVVSLLEGESSFDQVVQEVGENHLHVIPAGTRSSTNAVQLISSHRMTRFVNFLKQRYDHVIIDTPPVIELADAGILGSLSDDVYLIVRMNRTPRALVEQATRTLESYKAPVAGLIATDNPRHRRKYYYYRYGYRYSYRYYDKASAEAA